MASRSRSVSQSSNNQYYGHNNQRKRARSNSYRSSSPKRAKINHSWNIQNFAQRPPRLNLSDDTTLVELGLKDIVTEKKKKNALQKHHNKLFETEQTQWNYTRLSLADKRNVKDLGIRPYDQFILARKDDTEGVKRHVFRQGLSMHETDPLGRFKRKREHINSFYLMAEPAMKKWEPQFHTEWTDDALKFVADLQDRRPMDIPQHPAFLQMLTQLYGEAYHALYCIRQQLPVWSNIMRGLSAKLGKKDASLAFLKTLHWNVSTSVDICSQHDSFLSTAKEAEAFKSDKTRFNEIRDKIRKRRAEYRFKEEAVSHFQPYSDILPDPSVAKRRLKGNRETYNRQRREERDRRTSTRGRGKGRGRGRGNDRSGRNSYNDNRYSHNERYRHNNKDKRFQNDNRDRRRNKDTRQNQNDRRNRDTKNDKNKKDRRKNNKQDRKKEQREIECFHCGEIGHKKPSCPYLKGGNRT